MHGRTKCVPLISRHEIDAAVERLAEDLNRDYLGKNPLVIGILKGSFVFMADLVRHLNFPVEIEFGRLSSYGTGRETSGKVKVVHGLLTPVRGRDILIVEDIVDSGLTTAHFLDYIKRRRPASVKLCALADKASRRRTPVVINYLGFAVPDKFLVGYGLDWDEKYRNLPDICALEEDT